MPQKQTARTVISAIVIQIGLISGCATPISPDKMATADYGSPPPSNYESIIKNHFDKLLIDPTAPIYEMDTPRKGYTRQSAISNTSERFGWRICGTVNSKNRYGGYTGRTPFFALLRGDTVVELKLGSPDGNSAIEAACNR